MVYMCVRVVECVVLHCTFRTMKVENCSILLQSLTTKSLEHICLMVALVDVAHIYAKRKMHTKSKVMNLQMSK